MRLSGRTVAIKSIPTDLPPAEARNLFAEILDHIELDKRGGAKQTLRDDIAASLACKAAVKINMKLTQEKMQWLIDRLLVTSSPTTCPHGRPVILRLTMKDIERGFHRTSSAWCSEPKNSDDKLIRGAGTTGATALNMIDMIGVGPFITMPLIIAAMGGPQAMLGWILGAVLVMCDGLVWAELGASMPKSGGPYNYLKTI